MTGWGREVSDGEQRQGEGFRGRGSGFRKKELRPAAFAAGADAVDAGFVHAKITIRDALKNVAVFVAVLPPLSLMFGTI